MATKSQARQFAQLISEYAPEIRRGFMASVTDLRANVNWPLLLTSLESGSVEAAIGALNISEAAWAEYSASVSSAYAASGAATAAIIVQSGIGQIGVRFNMANPRAEDWIRREVGGSIVGFTREQVEVARSVILSGYSEGMNPRNIALDLVGRATGSSGAREGGVLGLDAPRADRLHKVSVGMRTPEGVKSLVTKHADGSLSVKYKVNEATSKRIISAYRNGTEVPEAQRIISERQYQNALLKARADTVAETETANAVLGARDEEWKQLIESGQVRRDDVVKTWRHGRGATTHHRPDHLAMSGTSVNGIDAPFVFPDGVQMQYAHDPDGGAKHTIRCGCSTDYTVRRVVL